MKLYIARHGQTHDNVKQLCSGQNNARLTALGISQAQALGRLLKRANIQRIVASDLGRVQETLVAIAQSIEVPTLIRAELRERDFGELEGAKFDDYLAAERAHPQGRDNFRPRGGESYADLRVRLAPIVRELPTYALECQAIAIVAHGNINRTLLAILLNGSPSDFTQRPACLNILEIDSGGRASAIALDSIDHLKE